MNQINKDDIHALVRLSGKMLNRAAYRELVFDGQEQPQEFKDEMNLEIEGCYVELRGVIRRIDERGTIIGEGGAGEGGL